MNKIKAIADKLKIAILLVHHTRKAPDSDPFNTISGTTGLTGSCDTMFVLEKAKRADSRAVLHVTGRDVEDMQINLNFDRDKKVWEFVSFADPSSNCNENTAVAVIEAVVALLTHRREFTGTATELAAILENSVTVKANVLSRILKERAPTLENQHGIKVEFKRANGVRNICLTISRVVSADDDVF
jgi:hypothetical protein